MASSGVGLDNVKKALVTIGGNVWLTAGTSGGRAASLIAALPTTLEGSFFDSSESFNSASSADTTPSATPQPSRPTPLPTRPSPQAGPAVPVRTLKVIGIDDDAMSRTVQCSLMEYVLAADLQVSGSIGGEQAERERFVDVALGALDLKLQPIAEGRPADVILIDQHIGADLLGTDVAASARGRGFGGVTVVLTGSSKGDVERIGALEHVDVCVEERRCPSSAPPSAARSPPRSRRARDSINIIIRTKAILSRPPHPEVNLTRLEHLERDRLAPPRIDTPLPL